MCDRVRPHTLIVGIGDTTTDPELFLFLFYFLNPTTTLLGRRLHSHLPVAEIAPHGRGPWRRVANQRVARGLWAAFLRGGGGSAAAAARDDMMKLGSCPSLLHWLAVDMKLFIHIHVHRFSADIYGYIHIHRPPEHVSGA